MLVPDTDRLETVDTVSETDRHETYDEQAIADLAYELWQQRGRPDGSPEDDWFHALELLRNREERALIARA